MDERSTIPVRLTKLEEDFKDFLTRGNVMDFVMAVVVGGALGKVVTVLVEGVAMPLLSKCVPGTRWENWTVSGFQIGRVVAAIVDFLVKAVAVYFIIIRGARVLARRRETSADASGRVCPACREEVHAEATRCRHCGSALSPGS